MNLIVDFNVTWSKTSLTFKSKYMMLITNLLILFCVQIKVKKVKKFQFNII